MRAERSAVLLSAAIRACNTRDTTREAAQILVAPNGAELLIRSQLYQTGGTDWLPNTVDNPSLRKEMDSSKQFGGDASLKDYMETNDRAAASSTISVEQQAQTLARMTLFERQRRRRLSATRAAVRKHEAGTADARARRRRDKLAALSPLAKAAGVAATDGVHARLAKCDRCSTRSIHRARSATSARTRELAASAGRAALRRQRGPREALDAQRAEAPVTPGAVVAPVPHAKLTGKQRRLVNEHRLRQDPPVASFDLYPDAYHADAHRSAPVFGDAGDRTCIVDAQPVQPFAVSDLAKKERASCVSLV